MHNFLSFFYLLAKQTNGKELLIGYSIATLTLGSRPRQGVARLWAKRRNQESHHTPLGVQKVWGNEPSHSQGKSHVGSWSPKWTSKSLERNCRGQNSSSWWVLYNIKKLLKRRCLKWAHISHLDIWNTSYGQKKGRESKWQFDSRPLKVRNQPDFLVCRRHATYSWKAIDEGYNFSLYFIAITSLHAKLCASKVARIPIVRISGFSLGSPRTKSHLDVAPMERHKVYYKGEDGGFPQVRAMVSLVCASCLWFVLTLKVLQLCN
jgi:hypothetical protein